VLVRDLGLRTPSSSGRSRLSANLSDDMSLVAGDIFEAGKTAAAPREIQQTEF
jgi:hypothetical protein